MNKAKEYFQYELASSNWDPIHFLKTMNHKTLEDVAELVKERLKQKDEYLDKYQVYELSWVITKLEKLKL